MPIPRENPAPHFDPQMFAVDCDETSLEGFWFVIGAALFAMGLTRLELPHDALNLIRGKCLKIRSTPNGFTLEAEPLAAFEKRMQLDHTTFAATEFQQTIEIKH